MGEEITGVLSILGMLVLFAGVLLLAYFTTRLVGRRLPSGGGSAGQIRVLERLPIGQDKALMIVEAAGKTLLIGVASHAVSLLCELDPEAIEPAAPQADAPFMNLLTEMLKNRGKGPKQRKETDEQG